MADQQLDIYNRFQKSIRYGGASEDLGCIIAAGSVLPKNTVVPDGSVFAGIPAKKIKEVGPELQKGEIERIASNYVHYASWFK